MTAEPVYFGPARRCLHGILHRPAGVPRGGMLVCAPLFQEGTRIYRALWTLAEKLAASGWLVLRFDWYGSGNSHGLSSEMGFDGLLADIGEAERFLREQHAATCLPGQAQAGQVAMLGVRSAAVPLLAFASGMNRRIDLFLLAPQFDGHAVIDGWRRQHDAQLRQAGRYPFGGPSPRADDLLGFAVDKELLDAFESRNAATMRLPAGSRVVIAGWDDSDRAVEYFAAVQREAGCVVDMMRLEPSEAPHWDVPDAFESQVFPRRSIAHVASVLSPEVA